MIFDLQRFADIKTVNQASVLSSAEVAAGKDSLGNNITSYVKIVEPNDSGLTITQGDNSTYSVTLQSGLDAEALLSATAGKANSLSSATSLKVSLASSAAQTFNGGADCTLIGVGGVLPVSNGGTGSSTGIATFSTSANGLVPKPSSASATLFLTAAGTWATAGGGTSSGSLVLTTTASTVNGAMWLA